MVNREIFTYLKNRKQLILVVTKKFKIFETIHHVIVNGDVWSNQLITWNNLFGVDVPLTEKTGARFAQGETKNCPRVKS